MDQNNDLEILKTHLNTILRPVDTEEVQKSSEILQEIFTRPECVGLLMSLLINDEEQNMRQIACVYLRSYINKLWPKLDNQTWEDIKMTLLQRYELDPSPLIKKSIAGVIGSLGKMLIPNGDWNQPFEFVMNSYTTENVVGQELSLLLLSYLIEYLSKDDIKEHFDDISKILSISLKSDHSSVVDFSIKCIKNCASATSNVKVLKSIQKMIPDILDTLSEENEERIQTVLDCLTSLVEYKGLLTPHISRIIEGALKVAENIDLHLNTRQRAILFFEFVPVKHSKMFKKKKQLLDTIISTLMKISCEPLDDYDQDEQSPSRYALYSMKSFSVYMHKPIIFPVLIKNIRACIESDLDNQRRAGIELLGFIWETDACLDPIKDHIDEITDVIVKWLYDESVLVKATTAETVGMFSENVSDFLQKPDQVIPAIVDTLGYLSNTDIPLQKALHALHSFVNNAEYSKITNILDEMINVLLPYMTHESLGVQKWTMEILSSVVIAADSKIEKYFDTLMTPCEYIFKNTTLKQSELKSQALETIGQLAKAVGREKFAPYLEEYSQMSLETLQNQEYHFMREACFSYFCSISKFMKSDMASILPSIVEQIFITIERDDLKVNNQRSPQDFSLDSDSDKEQDVCGKVEAFDEKASAINWLGYLFRFWTAEMTQFLEQISKMLLRMIEYVEENIRFECVTALTHITIGLNRLQFGEDFEWEVGFKNCTNIGEDTEMFLKAVYFPWFSIVFDTEDENDVIERMLHSLIEITESLGAGVYQNRLPQILTLINNLLENPSNIDNQDDGEGDFEDVPEGDDEEEDIDHNETVLANITELISVLSRVMGEDLAEHFEKTAELLFMHCGENYPMRDKSLCIGTLGECFNNMPSLLKKWFDQFYKHIMDTFNESDNEDLIRNLAFAIGVWAENQPKMMKPHVQDVLEVLNSVIDKVRDQATKDNIISALFKLTTYNFDSVPYESMCSVLYESIPLKDDLDENEPVSKWLILLLNHTEETMKPYMLNILKTIMWTVIESESLTKAPIRTELAGWLKNMTESSPYYAEIVETISAPLTQEQLQNFQKFCP